MRYEPDLTTDFCHAGSANEVCPDPESDHAVSFVTLPVESAVSEVPPTHVTYGLAPGMSGSPSSPQEETSVIPSAAASSADAWYAFWTSGASESSRAEKESLITFA